MEANRKYELLVRLKQGSLFTCAAVLGAAVGEGGQSWVGGGPAEHLRPAIVSTGVAVLLALLSWLWGVRAARYGGRGYVISIHANPDVTRHNSGLRHLSGRCAFTADLMLRVYPDLDTRSRAMQLAGQAVSTLLDNDLNRQSQVTGRSLIINMELHNALAVGAALRHFKDTQPVQLLHDTRHNASTGYFAALRIPLGGGNVDPDATCRVEQVHQGGTVLAVAVYASPNPNFFENVLSRVREVDSDVRAVVLIERTLAAPDESDFCYEALVRSVDEAIMQNRTSCASIRLYLACPAALAAGIGSRMTAGLPMFIDVLRAPGKYEERVAVPAT